MRVLILICCAFSSIICVNSEYRKWGCFPLEKKNCICCCLHGNESTQLAALLPFSTTWVCKEVFNWVPSPAADPSLYLLDWLAWYWNSKRGFFLWSIHQWENLMSVLGKDRCPDTVLQIFSGAKTVADDSLYSPSPLGLTSLNLQSGRVPLHRKHIRCLLLNRLGRLVYWKSSRRGFKM